MHTLVEEIEQQFSDKPKPSHKKKSRRLSQFISEAEYKIYGFIRSYDQYTREQQSHR